MTRKNATFADVLELHGELDFVENDGLIATSLDGKFDRLAEKDPKCFAVSCWKSFRNVPFRTGSCIFGVLNTTIDKLNSMSSLQEAEAYVAENFNWDTTEGAAFEFMELLEARFTN